MVESIDVLEKESSAKHTQFINLYNSLERRYRNFSKGAITKMERIGATLSQKMGDIDAQLHKNRSKIVDDLPKCKTSADQRKLMEKRRGYEISALKKEIKAIEVAINALKKLE